VFAEHCGEQDEQKTKIPQGAPNDENLGDSQQKTAATHVDFWAVQSGRGFVCAAMHGFDG